MTSNLIATDDVAATPELRHSRVVRRAAQRNLAEKLAEIEQQRHLDTQRRHSQAQLERDQKQLRAQLRRLQDQQRLLSENGKYNCFYAPAEIQLRKYARIICELCI